MSGSKNYGIQKTRSRVAATSVGGSVVEFSPARVAATQPDLNQ